MSERTEKIIVYAGSDLDAVTMFAIGSIVSTISDNFHLDAESFVDDYPESTPKEYEITITVKEK